MPFEFEDEQKPAGGAFVFDDEVPAAKRAKKSRSWLDAAADTGVQLAEGTNNILGAIPSLVAPNSDTAEFFKRGAEFWRNKQSDELLARQAEAGKVIDRAGQDGVWPQVKAAASEYASDPALAARFAVTNIPSLIPGLGLGKLAQVGGAAVGLSAAAQAALGTGVAGATNAALNAGSARGDAYDEIKKSLIDKGLSPADAEEIALQGSVMPAAVGAATGYLSGKVGLEKALLGSVTAGGAAKKAAGSFAAEMMGEQAEEVLPKLATNTAVQVVDPTRQTGKDVGRTIVETAFGAGPTSVAAAGSTGLRAYQTAQPETPPSAITPETGNPATPAAAPAPAPAATTTITPQSSSVVATSGTEAAEKALREPVSLTALDRVAEIDAELSQINLRERELLNPENGYGPAFDAERAELAAQAQAIGQERERIAATWPTAQRGAPTTFSTEAGVKLDGQYALMDADDLVTSHDEGLKANPLYPKELQPRDRSRSASELQVSGIVQKLEPARLGLSADATTGAPIVGADGLVESGNARTIALKRVYSANAQKSADYKDFLRSNADQFGFDAAAVDGMAKPVLVRVRSTPVNRAEFARQANASTVQRMSASEQALSDAKRLTSLDGLNPDDEGNFTSSHDFIRQFMGMLPLTEQAELIESDGRLSTQGYRRVQNAVLAKAYGDSPTLRRMTESPNNNLRNVGNALVRVAPTIAAARERMDAGTLHAADIAPDLVLAVEGLSALKERGWSVADELGQGDLTGPKYSQEAAVLLQFLSDNARSPRRMAEFVQRYYEALEGAGDPSQASMFGDGAAPSRTDLLNAAKGAADANTTQEPQRGADRESTQPVAQDGGQPQDAPGNRGGNQVDGVAKASDTGGQQQRADGGGGTGVATAPAAAGDAGPGVKADPQPDSTKSGGFAAGDEVTWQAGGKLRSGVVVRPADGRDGATTVRAANGAGGDAGQVFSVPAKKLARSGTAPTPQNQQATPAPEAGPTNQGATNGQWQETLLKAEQPTGAAMVSGAPVEAGNAGNAPAPSNRAEYVAEVRRQLGDLMPGDVLENDMGDRWTVEVVMRNKNGEITGFLPMDRNADADKNALMDIDSAGTILFPTPYRDASGNRKMSGHGKVIRANTMAKNSGGDKPAIDAPVAKKPSDTTKPGGFIEKAKKAAGKVDAAPEQPILTAPTKADIEAQQARAEQAAKSKAAQDKADAASAAKERERKEVAAASVAAADTFELGGDAMANLTGQNDLQFSRDTESPRTPAATIRAAITKAYGSLLDKLEAKGLVTIAQTEREAIEAAAQARADKTGGDVEQIKRSMLASVQMQRVWHGTPHRGIQQFSTEKIGTGEGAQAYGWGLYYASKQEIAEDYRKKLSGGADQSPRRFFMGQEFQPGTGGYFAARIVESSTLAKARKDVSEWIKDAETWSDRRKADKGEQETLRVWIDALAILKQAYSKSDFTKKSAQGQLYEVEIPEDGDMLLWDKPLSEQPAPARNSAKTMKGDIAQDWLENELDRLNADWNELTGQELYKLVQRALVDDALVPNTGSMAEQALIEGKTDKAASLLLMDDGIKGIKYLDGTSRSAGDGSYNYVIFDGSDTQIVDVKYSANGNIEGFFDKQTGKSFLVADNLTAASAPGTLMHEVGIHMAADGKLDRLFKRAAFLIKTNRGQPFFDRVRSRMEKAGETSAEEAAAYLVTEYETDRVAAPKSVVQWVREFMSDVRAWLFSKGIILKADQLTVADIAAVARANARSMARGGPSGGLGVGEVAFSRAPSPGPQGGGRKTVAERVEDILSAKVGKIGMLDAATKVLTRVTGIERLTSAAFDHASSLLSRYTPERVKAGLVADYGVPQAVIDQRTQLQGRQRVQLRKAGALIDKLSTLTREESRVAYEWMNMDGADPRAYMSMMQGLPEESVKVLTDVQKMIDQLSKEAVRMGQLSQEAYERNQFAYLRRSYAKHILAQTGREKAKRARTISILGEQYKGRGLTEYAPMEKIKAAMPDWWGRKLANGKADTALKGERFVRLEYRTHKQSGSAMTRVNGGKVVPSYVTRNAMADTKTGTLAGTEVAATATVLKEVVYWPVGEAIPAKYKDWDRAGTWEVRDVKGPNAIFWRDFTKDERELMGEVDEARFAIAKTLHAMIHDVEVGRYLEWLAVKQAKKEGDAIPGEVVEASERYQDAFNPNEWVRVPDTKISGTDVLKYGKLAGRYLPGPVWNDLRQVVGGQFNPFGDVYAQVLSVWKTSKTALSPAVHMNNVMSNFVMADWHDVGAAHVAKALRILLAGSSKAALAKAGIADREAAGQILIRYADSGGDVGSWATQEIARDQLEPLLESLEKELALSDGASVEAQTGAFVALQHAMMLRFPSAWEALKPSKAGKVLRAGAGGLLDLYQAEDDVFRLAAWLKAKEDGATDIDAGRAARQSFLDYQINAPWVQAMRQSAWPFISFTYRAVPMLAEIAGKKPHKLMKLMMIAGGLNALGTMLAGGGDDDERKLLPEEKAGSIWGMVPKLIRMPWNDDHGSPVYLDIRRWIPVGDVFDIGQGNAAVPMLPGLMPGGPLVLAGEVVLNKSAFTGKPITLETDTAAEKAQKLGGYLYKALTPNLIGLPGTYATDGVVGSMTGRTDAFGREMSTAQAVASSFGVKLGSYPADVLRRNLDAKAQAELMEIQKNISQLKRRALTGRLDRDEFTEAVEAEQEKKKKVVKELREKLN